jgi:hypothetical protein
MRIACRQANITLSLRSQPTIPIPQTIHLDPPPNGGASINTVPDQFWTQWLSENQGHVWLTEFVLQQQV